LQVGNIEGRVVRVGDGRVVGIGDVELDRDGIAGRGDGRWEIIAGIAGIAETVEVIVRLVGVIDGRTVVVRAGILRITGIAK